MPKRNERGRRAKMPVVAAAVFWALGGATAGGSTEKSVWPSAPERAEAISAAADFLAARDGELARRLSPAGGQRPFIAYQGAVKSLPLPPGHGEDIRVHVPQRGDEVLEVEGVKLKPLGAKGVSAQLAQGRAVYADLYDRVDGLLVRGSNWVEMLWLLRSENAKRRFEWEVMLPKGTAVKRSSDGGLEFATGAGEVFWRVKRPYGVDARGSRIEARLEWAGTRLAVAVEPPDGAAFPLLVDPVVEVPGWNLVSKGMPPGGHAMAALGTKAVLFGGRGFDGSKLAQTWEWDGISWAEKAPAQSPPARLDHAMATLGAKVVLFGGQDANRNHLSDTWEWDGANWVRRAPAQSPPARELHAMATLATKVVLFGGIDASGNKLSDTWEWDGANWTQRAPAQSPPARDLHAMATLGTKVVLFGGRDASGNKLSDTWEWDGVNWTQRQPTSSPSARQDHRLATLGTKVVLFGGKDTTPYSDTWEWDGTAWRQLTPARSPSARNDQAMTTVGSKVVLFGGLGSTGRLSDTWEWDGANWTQKMPAQSPPARELHAMATQGAKVVLFGGYNGTTELSDTWEWDGASWTQKAPGQSPSGRYGHAMASLGTKVGLFGGHVPDHDTWHYVLPLPDGSACSVDAQCASGSCVDGACCSSTCGAGDGGDRGSGAASDVRRYAVGCACTHGGDFAFFSSAPFLAILAASGSRPRLRRCPAPRASD